MSVPPAILPETTCIFEVWQNGERTDALGYFKAKE